MSKVLVKVIQIFKRVYCRYLLDCHPRCTAGATASNRDHFRKKLSVAMHTRLFKTGSFGCGHCGQKFIWNGLCHELWHIMTSCQEKLLFKVQMVLGMMQINEMLLIPTFDEPLARPDFMTKPLMHVVGCLLRGLLNNSSLPPYNLSGWSISALPNFIVIAAICLAVAIR